MQMRFTPRLAECSRTEFKQWEIAVGRHIIPPQFSYSANDNSLLSTKNVIMYSYSLKGNTDESPERRAAISDLSSLSKDPMSDSKRSLSSCRFTAGAP